MATENGYNLLDYPNDYKPKKYVLTEEEKAASKYGKLVFKFPKEENEIVAKGDAADFVVHPQAYFRGARQIPGSSFNCSFQIFVKPFFLDRGRHVHPETDEYLIFLGASFPDVFDFDARVEITYGKGDDEETFVITEPAIIRFPAGVYHCPLNFREVNKPILFLAASMMPMFGGYYDLPNGETTWMQYNGPLNCKYDPNKKCDACGDCLAEKWQRD